MAQGKITIGSVVVLKSGGPNMLVKASRDGIIDCVWADGHGQCQETTLPSACLSVVRKPSKAKS
jgi:uncharacterized protein YodC (DUF2158 family)